MSNKLIFLGTGTSRGIPILGCECETCKSADPRDARLRASVAVQSETTTILIDCGPDLRQQLLRENLTRVDAFLLTHTHGDHLLGIDDLQMITQVSHQELPFYALKKDIDTVNDMFPYIQNLKRQLRGEDANNNGLRWSVPQFKIFPWEDQQVPVTIGDFKVWPIPMYHGKDLITGYRIGNCAYLSDCSKFPPEAYPLLEDLDIMVIDGLRWKAHSTHFCFEQAFDEIQKIKPKKAYLTHLTHDILHQRDSQKLPAGVFLPYDGLKVEFA